MSGVDLAHLQGLYAQTGDPWDFRSSGYEQARFDATRAALARDSYRAILELGCGNGELARRLSPLAGRYVGLDAVDRAVTEARAAVPRGEFHRAWLPGPLPAGRFDLIVVSEVLYFLDRAGITALADQIACTWPGAEILSVNYLGPSGNTLQGGEAADIFARCLAPRFAVTLRRATRHYRIDRFQPVHSGDTAE